MNHLTTTAGAVGTTATATAAQPHASGATDRRDLRLLSRRVDVVLPNGAQHRTLPRLWQRPATLRRPRPVVDPLTPTAFVRSQRAEVRPRAQPAARDASELAMQVPAS